MFRSTTAVIGATKDNGTENANQWGSNFDIEATLDAYKCQHDKMHLRAFDKYYLPKRLHYSATTQVESVHLLMDNSRKTTSRSTEGCSNSGYTATHGWDNKNAAMQVPLTLYGPDIKQDILYPSDITANDIIGSVQNIEIYKLIINLLKIEKDSNNLNKTVIPEQFSEWGKFASLLKNPTNVPMTDKTDFHRPVINEDESNFEIENDQIKDKRINSFPIFMTKDRLMKYDWKEMIDLKPFWWDTMIDNININGTVWAGAAFDTTGQGIYSNPDTWTDGRTGHEHKPGSAVHLYSKRKVV